MQISLDYLDSHIDMKDAEHRYLYANRQTAFSSPNLPIFAAVPEQR